MAQIEGEFKHVKNESLEEFLDFYSPDPEQKLKYLNSKVSIIVKQNGDQFTFGVSDGSKEASSNFKLGALCDENYTVFGTLKTLVTRDGNKFVFQSTTSTGKEFTRTYDFTPSGVTLTLSSSTNPIQAKRFYEKV